jgi:hypothetical protein
MLQVNGRDIDLQVPLGRDQLGVLLFGFLTFQYAAKLDAFPGEMSWMQEQMFSKFGPQSLRLILHFSCFLLLHAFATFGFSRPS